MKWVADRYSKCEWINLENADAGLAVFAMQSEVTSALRHKSSLPAFFPKAGFWIYKAKSAGGA